MSLPDRHPGSRPAELREMVERRRDAIRQAVRRHRGHRVCLFGSVARGEEHAGSDIDLLVDFEPGSSLFDLLRLERELKALLGRQVDVVSRGGLRSRDTRILDEAVEL